MGQLSYKLFFLLGLSPVKLDLPKTDTSGAWQRTQRLRQAQLSAACKRPRLWQASSLLLPKPVSRQLLVEPNHRLLFCEVTKASCSDWRRVLLLLLALNLSRWDPAEVQSDKLHHTRLSSFQRRDCDLMLNHYIPVLVTRHPLERLVSAYRDKFLHSEPYYVHLAASMRTAVRGSGPSRAQQNQRNLTFAEFVTFVLRQSPATWDVHWKPIELLCSPCRVRYAVLIRHESLSLEAAHALSFLGIPSPGLFPSSKVYQSESRTGPQLTRHYPRQLSPEQQSGLYSLYFLDFTLFGYHPLTP
ncbi:carbohydrate sulfotransferase 8-like [Monodelphis domestica]|uniref:carbohydrate sulfotransferase 8-like n=1 Tax=Monodelphis domestica TaxID=13616 RepID=UPI0024E1DF69|nr:carbohydrate sulfotransferase 8-like [Monodelphis domestica]XP_056666268.1 carbohydrate sulfotransferase 8-like [Monodelphis domestica]XP_056666269.1 carbohydrate sulfotransferase 8-like [Monodelphis domestica]XP_056666270.1 carbohydrate sulfotransferase 8-like [Monodelphis domestica]XP_056666271.1 carbohydrate sulfotransferase 8-like [Monodelphis domestica]